MILGLLVTLLGAAPAAPPSPPRWAELDTAARAEVLRSLHPLPLPERLLEVSRRFLETPYQHSPLGEGAGPDPDPTERYDAVDCLTFVEETIALGLGGTPDEASELLQRLRYGAAQTYADRNHLMEAEWLPHNVEKGFLKDVTRTYGGQDAVWTEKLLDKTTWQSRSSTALALPVDRQVVGRYRFPMIPLAKVMAHARDIPSGTLLIVVRDDLRLKPTRITHLGFVVQKKKRTYLRHAARNSYMRVIDEDLETFLTRNSKYEKWRVSGVSLYQVLPRLQPQAKSE